MTPAETRIAQHLVELANPKSEAHQEALRKVTAARPEMHEALLMHELSQNLARMLQELPEFSGGQPMIRLSRGSIGLATDQAAAILIRRVRATGDGVAAMSALMKVLGTQRAPGIEIMLAQGFTCSTEIQLTDTIRIVPVSSLRPSSNLSATTAPREPDFSSFARSYRHSPAAALVMNLTIDPVIVRANAGTRPAQLELHEQLTDALHTLALVEDVVPRQAASWFEYDDPDLREVATFGRFGRSYELLPPYADKPVHLEPGIIGNTVRNFFQLQPSHQGRIRIALERIIQSRCWSAPGNKALELGIALEVLLVDQSGEHTHKIGVRCARMIAQSHDQRLQVKRLLSALYETRSRMVHTGRTDNDVKISGRGRTSVTDVVQEATACCCQLIRACLERGAIPDWEDFDLT